MTQEIQIPLRIVLRIMKEDFGLSAYRRSIGQRLTDNVRQMKAIRAK